MVCSPVGCEGSGRCAKYDKGRGQARPTSVSGVFVGPAGWCTHNKVCVCLCAYGKGADVVRKLDLWAGKAVTMCAASLTCAPCCCCCTRQRYRGRRCAGVTPSTEEADETHSPGLMQYVWRCVVA